MIAALARTEREPGAIAAALPGIRVVAAPAAAADPLPRMDVALFAGFASSGPVHCPVAIDSVAAFAAVFGADPVLAWDAARGESVRGLLGPAVRAFFENGGRRAQVIRVCRNAGLAGLSRAASEPLASANLFPVPGVLTLTASGLGQARVQARSLGSWSDRLQVRARCERSGFRPREISLDVSLDTGGLVHFAGAMALAPGELVELADMDDTRRAYLRVERSAAGRVEARLLARFTRLATGGERIGQAIAPALRGPGIAARLVPGTPTRLEWLAPAPEGLASGHVLRFDDGAEAVFLDTGTGDATIEAGGDARGTAWTLGDSGALPVDRAARLTLDLLVEDGGGTLSLQTGLGLTPGAPGAWWNTLGDDEFYRPGDAAQARTPIASEPAEDAIAWLPLGLDNGFGTGLPALPQAADALERDGLARFDAGLFLDPRLADLGPATLVSEAERILGEPGGRLLGVHGVLAVPPGSGLGEQLGDLASIVALPDAVHAGWERWQDDAPALALPGAVAAPAHWAGHRGPCPEDAGALVRPAFDRFLDCGTRVLPAPELLLPEEPVTPGPLMLRWRGSEEGAGYVLELSGEPGMAGAVEIARTGAVEYPIVLEREGSYFFRLTAERTGEVSLPALGAVRVRASAWRVADKADEAVLDEVHRGMLRLAAAEGSLFALLSLPRGADAGEAIAAAGRLRAERGAANPRGFGFGERNALSYGTLLHGWLFSAARAGRPGDPPPVTASPPCGVIAGVLARHRLAGGAWLSPANQELRGPVALARPVDADLAQALVEARVMPLRETPAGFVLADAHTLADEEEWRPVGTRRLFGFLRRLVTARGAVYAFEPNGPLLHRTIERGLSEALLTLFRAGAFAGFKPAEAFRVTVRATDQDRDAGRLVTEIAVAPARPLSFLTLVLRQVGEQLTIEEGR